MHKRGRDTEAQSRNLKSSAVVSLYIGCHRSRYSETCAGDGNRTGLRVRRPVAPGITSFMDVIEPRNAAPNVAFAIRLSLLHRAAAARSSTRARGRPPGSA